MIIPDNLYHHNRIVAGKIARINRNRKLSYAMRLAAIVACDNRPGINWR